ncbi:MAG: hypothetical protein AABW91_02585, partial [Nanoarchaeota archaeon]
MYLWKTNSRCLAVVFLFLLFPILICAKEIVLEYPEKINSEEFSMNLILKDFLDDNYDVKIDILSNGKRITKILDLNSGYKSTYYFVNDAIKSGDNQASFDFKITENYNGKSDIEVKIRDSKGKTSSFKGYITEMSVTLNNKETNINENEPLKGFRKGTEPNGSKVSKT